MRIALSAALAAAGLVGISAAAKAASVEVGAGVADFNRELSSETDVGPAWNVMLGASPSEVLNFELGYNGSRVDLDEDRGFDGVINQHGVAGHARVNLATGAVQPFVFGGVGGSYLDYDRTLVRDDDLVLDVPAGAGVEFDVGRFKVNGRFNYGFIFASEADADLDDAAIDAEADRGSFDRWSATLNLGAEL